MRINRAYVRKLENIIIRIAIMFSDIEEAERKGYLARDISTVKKEADAIIARRKLQ